MSTVLYIFYPTVNMCNPVYAVATPPVDCTRLSEDDLYCLKDGEFIKWYSKLVCIPEQQSFVHSAWNMY
jgi:hypothetical protein